MRKFKSKKRFKILPLIIFFLIIYLVLSITKNIKLFSSNEEFLYRLLQDSNHYIKYEENDNIVSDIIRLVFNYQKKESANYILNPVVNPVVNNVVDNEIKPKIYIYNSHQLENYNSEKYEPYNITPNVMMASYILKEMLEKNDIPTLVENTNLIEYMNLNNYGYAYSYKASRFFLEKKIKENPSLEFYIDLHRDSINKSGSTANIDNKNYARILFVVGLEHQNYKTNLEVANTINNMVKNKYPSLTRGVITKQGHDVNGIYNQDISGNMILLEVGAYQNTIDEVYNTLEVFAPILKEYLYGR